jgi:NTP pyrophosphatase (non-canonical NTP hydrolase)
VAFGIALGAAELLAHFRFLSEERAHGALTDPSGREAVEDELAEALFFVLRFAQRFGVDIAGRLKRTFAMNAARYPVKKSRVRSAKCPES